MFEPSSRYANCEDLQMQTSSSSSSSSGEGKIVQYKARRFLPPYKSMTLLQEVTVTSSDRLDILAARIIGDPEQYWRICDANDILHPMELTSEPGRQIRIAVPW